MMMLARAALLLGICGLAGCGGGEAAVTDPAKLAPLTQEQLEEIRRQDAQVELEERGTPVIVKKGKARS